MPSRRGLIAGRQPDSSHVYVTRGGGCPFLSPVWVGGLSTGATIDEESDEDSDDSEVERERFVTAVTEVVQRLLREDASGKSFVATDAFDALQASGSGRRHRRRISVQEGLILPGTLWGLHDESAGGKGGEGGNLRLGDDSWRGSSSS